MWLVNGQASERISVQDRGLTLGDGFFTTVQLRHGRPLLWPLHTQRLLDSARRLRMPTPDIPSILNRLQKLAQHGPAALCGKVIVTRGQGARGYGIEGCSQPTEILSVHDYPAHYRLWQRDGVTLGVCQARLGASSLLAGLKTLNRLEQVLLKAELEQRGLLEGVTLDESGCVVECVTANLFWCRDSVVYTPVLARSGVAGVMRAWVLSQLGQRGLSCREVSAPLHELLSADAVFMTNALMEVVPVSGIEDVIYTNHSVARELQTLFLQAT